MTDPEIGVRAQIACLLELAAPKPGNVTLAAGFQDARVEHYLASAAAIGPSMAAAGERRVGATVRAAVRATRAHVSVNTNLGIILLLAPLARAATGRPPLRARLREVLRSLNVQDAVATYEAIREAAPAGLGHVPEQDVREQPGVSLREAMALAADRDSIAREYATDFELTFETTAPAIAAARGAGLDWPAASVQAFLQLLARVPDSLIARKLGREAAEEVTRAARRVIDDGGMRTEVGRRGVAALDRELRDPENTRNPGTTADLVAAGLFVVLSEHDERI